MTRTSELAVVESLGEEQVVLLDALDYRRREASAITSFDPGVVEVDEVTIA
jgi:hypothetical protein